MFRLSGVQLDSGLAAIKHHTYGSFFPTPPEFLLIDSQWTAVQTYLADRDLDTYTCYEGLKAFVPKSRLNIRFVSLLHPFDLLIYTALVMLLRDHINRVRIPATAQRVFSFRSERAAADMLYASRPGYWEFRGRQRKKAKGRRNRFVGITDIADFYPRIYHHRLKNALEAACPGGAMKDVIRTLDKLLGQFSGGTSYGIPVGPAASRPLAEAILIDVDNALKAYSIDFLRFVDDFVIFARSNESAEAGLHILGETLFTQHGLTLQTAKTNVLTSKDFIDKHLAEHSDREEKRRQLIELISADDYEERSYEELDKDEQAEIDALNLTEMLEEALAPGQTVDYSEVSFILGRLSALQQPDLIPIVLKNIHRLYPVAHSVTAFFQKFDSLAAKDQKRIAQKLLASLLAKPQPPVYYVIWILHLFYISPSWNHADDLLRIFRRYESPIVKRYAALALSVSGSRAHALALKEHIGSSPPLLKTAILLASQRLGDDERKYWLRGLRLTDPLEKLVAFGAM